MGYVIILDYKRYPLSFVFTRQSFLRNLLLLDDLDLLLFETTLVLFPHLVLLHLHKDKNLQVFSEK